MPNHLNHPCDSILTGDLTVLNWFTAPGNLSVKIDGSPSVGFGINPATQKFAVATKSFLNKKKIKIAHSHEEIDALYIGEVANILHSLFDYVPREYDTWIQADWIGLGGNHEYTPNTITYKFPEMIEEDIILAPHTEYWGTDNLNTCQSSPLSFHLKNTQNCKFVQPKAYIVHNQESFSDVEEVCDFARQMSTTVQFVSDKEAARITKELNACIRENREVEDDAFDCDCNLIRFWKLVRSIKLDCLFLCRNTGPEAYIGYDRVDGEGYCLSNEYGTFKLVDRSCFSRHNFNSGRFQSV